MNFKMEDMDFCQASIDNTATTSSDESTEKSFDTYNTNKGVVLWEHKGQLSNTNYQIINEQGTEIPVQTNSISKKDHEWKLPLQNYLNPGRTYSDRSAFKLPKNDTKKAGVSLEYLFMVCQNPFRGTIS